MPKIEKMKSADSASTYPIVWVNFGQILHPTTLLISSLVHHAITSYAAEKDVLTNEYSLYVKVASLSAVTECLDSDSDTRKGILQNPPPIRGLK